ncbi:MAG: alpha-galactosidase [Bacteroidales bacterium]|nr:alpha-galactosidase [Bacteroidales bacterium]
MKSILYCIAVLLLVGCSARHSQEVISLNQGWKFTMGDSLAFIEPGLNDTSWDSMPVDKIWEECGYDPYDGYAWYRLRFFLPSSLKLSASLQDSLLLFLGKINNWDQTFLNGTIIGINGRNVPAGTVIDTGFLNAPVNYWDLERRYTLAAGDPRILWDQENVLAIRVFDQGGQGGIYTGNQETRMTRMTDYLKIDYNREPFAFHLDSLKKQISLINRSENYTLTGKLKIRAVNKLTGTELLRRDQVISLDPLAEEILIVAIQQLDQSALFTYRFDNGDEEPLIATEESPYLCTPAPPASPRINGATVFGCRPGKPFLFAIAATGERPLTYAATGLPVGLTLDVNTGIITGETGGTSLTSQTSLTGPTSPTGLTSPTSEYQVEIVATNRHGADTGVLKIVIGDRIALTPPMGWNSWNCWGLAVDQEKVLATAKAFRDMGLINHGWTFVNIDDGWEIPKDQEPKRDQKGTILTNEKFPDIKALGDSIHTMGLKLGIYSSPGPLTCGGYTASYGHELQDARTFAGWGVDYLKYDWCSYGNIAKDTTRDERKKPYFVMRNALRKVDRDIVYSLCQYGMNKVWEWGEEVGGNLWRTTGDITDTWESLREIGFNQVENAPYAGPGHWNDPDMLIVGWVGWGPSLHPTRLTPDEQYTHISLWCLLSAPLLIGCDLDRLDPFTLNLLTNDEVLALDQDPMGKQATPVIIEGDIQVWVKELEDGNKAIGIFNLGEKTTTFPLDLEKAGCQERVSLRDLWRQSNLGTFTDRFETKIPSHGVVLVKTTPN